MAAILKDLGGRLAHIARSIKERSLPLQITTIELVDRLAGALDQASDLPYR